MAWLPAFKFLSGLFAKGGQFLTGAGQPYEGAYHKLYNGKTFTGSKPGKNSVEIFLDDSEPHFDLPTYEDKLVTEPTLPEPGDYDKGFFNRYFIKDLRGGKIVEVNKITFDKKEEKKYLIGTTVRWILQKPVKDIFNQGFLFKGAATRNKENTMKASLQMKGIDQFITKYDKYVNIESDVEGFKFEELPPQEKRRIIQKQSPLRTPPKLEYPHMMYDPNTGESVLTETVEEHEIYVKRGWVHEKPRFVKKLKRKIRGRGPSIKRTTPVTPSTSTPSSGGGGGGDYTVEEQFGDPQENIPGGGGGSSAPSSSPSQNNYY